MAFQDWPTLGVFFVAVIPTVLTTVALLIMCIALEIYAARDQVQHNRWFGILVQATYPVTAGLVAMPLRSAWHALGVPSLLDLTSLAPWVQIVLMTLLVDFLRYWEHRFEHRFWWPVHAVHHSQTDLHAASGYGHPLQSVPERLWFTIPLSLINSNAAAPAIVGLVFAFQVFFIHAPIRWHFGPLRRLLVDGPYHRIHHSIEPRHFGKNFSIVFSIWDQLFRTAYFPAKDEWPDTGVAGIEPPRTFADYLTKPFQQRWKS